MPGALAQKEDFGVIVIEGARYDFPTPEFIVAVQRVAQEKKAVIVVDEITSGWRMTDGGVYKLNSLKPDIVVYGEGVCDFCCGRKKGSDGSSPGDIY
jgi:glutamate-1-semialdehyde aminotransferase